MDTKDHGSLLYTTDHEVRDLSTNDPATELIKIDRLKLMTWGKNGTSPLTLWNSRPNATVVTRKLVCREILAGVQRFLCKNDVWRDASKDFMPLIGWTCFPAKVNVVGNDFHVEISLFLITTSTTIDSMLNGIHQ